MGIAAAMQQWNLHRRIALQVMRVVGTDARRLLFGLLLATATVSLWISNTATAAMMFPIGLALIAEFERESGRRLAGYGAALMLAVAYGANVGGIGTKIGTVPSAQLSGFLAQRGVEVSFLEFAAIGVPFVLLFLPVVWLALWRVGRADAPARGGRPARARGRGRAARRDAARREDRARGVPRHRGGVGAGQAAHRRAARARAARTSPPRTSRPASRCSRASCCSLWRVGGGACSSPPRCASCSGRRWCCSAAASRSRRAIQASGLSHWLGAQLDALRAAPPFAQVGRREPRHRGALGVRLERGDHRRDAARAGRAASRPSTLTAMLFAATFSASCDFALPAGTPPNAIVFGSGYLTIPLMARTGVVLDVARRAVRGDSGAGSPCRSSYPPRPEGDRDARDSAGSAGSRVALAGAGALAVIATARGEPISSAWFLVAALCIYALGYRFYSGFLARARVRARRRARDARAPPARRQGLRADQPLGRVRPPLRRDRGARAARRARSSPRSSATCPARSTS